jgi:two-component SAPR family response regulator
MVSASLFENRRVLVVEDEYATAQWLGVCLREAGAVVVGPMASAEAALGSLGGSGVDLAILDIDLGGRSALPVAAALTKCGVPFVFTTGYSLQSLPAPYESVPCCQKPVTLEEVERALGRVMLERRGADKAGDPQPLGPDAAAPPARAEAP